MSAPEAGSWSLCQKAEADVQGKCKDWSFSETNSSHLDDDQENQPQRSSISWNSSLIPLLYHLTTVKCCLKSAGHLHSSWQLTKCPPQRIMLEILNFVLLPPNYWTFSTSKNMMTTHPVFPDEVELYSERYWFTPSICIRCFFIDSSMILLKIVMKRIIFVWLCFVLHCISSPEVS